MTQKKPNVLSIVPVRGGSKGLPGKNLLPIAGRPLVLHTYDFARNASLVDRSVVSTDDEAIAKAVLDDGGDVVLRPAKLAQDDSRVETALVHTLTTCEERDGIRYDVVLYMEATIPVRHKDMPDKVLTTLFEHPEATSVITMIKAPIHPFWMVQIGEDGYLDHYKENECSRRQLLPEDCFYPDGSVYALRRNELFNCLKNPKVYNYMGDRPLGIEQDTIHSFDVDYKLDYDVAKYVVENLWKDN
ncbi:acylneuraminate cytidylyltransferase family protein [uncultured Desulfobacter sp.]|uniref:acylneuraminate cytidylyltransferase family protein n=1 Tax=uncultured Desulfobacter sp. TaxID=240139 RepID=UPI0029F53C49|nr:acylneuraminate cytidylyltransferase family protein [uncultured Desulfobacter sp.]